MEHLSPHVSLLSILEPHGAFLSTFFFSPGTMKLKKSSPKPSSYIKFQTKGIKVVGKWKQVKIDPSLFADGRMDDLVCFEELTDYRLVSPARNPSSLFSKEEPRKRKARAASEEEEGDSSSPKKKIKLKRSKGVVPEGASAQEELQAQEAGPEECQAGGGSGGPPEPQAGREASAESLSHTLRKKKTKKGSPQPASSQSTGPKGPKKAKTWVAEAHDHKADVSAWKDLFVPKPVLRALSFLGFSAPTPIQALTLAPAIRDKLDVLGAAETGRGIWPP